MTNTRSNAYYIKEVIDSGILASVSPAHGQVYIAYVRYSNGGVKDAFPSQDKLSDNLGIDVRTIRRAIKKLDSLGYIKQVSSGKGKGSKKSNLFTVMMPSQLGFPKKSATQAPVPPAPVPVQRPKPLPASAAAPAPTPVVPVASPAPTPQLASILTPDQIKQLEDLYFTLHLDFPAMIDEFPTLASLVRHVESVVKTESKLFSSILYDLKTKSLEPNEEELPF